MTVSAQNKNFRPVPKPEAPGVEFVVPKARQSFTPPVKRNEPSRRVSVAKKSKRSLVAPSLSGETDKPADTLLVKKYGVTRNGEQDGYTSVTYDEYGHRKTMEKFDGYGDMEESYKYEYKYNTDFNVWTEKYVERKEGNEGTFSPYEKEMREISANGYLMRRVIYGTTYNDSYEEIFAVKEDTKYDYAHSFTDDNGNKTWGHVVESTYDFGGAKEKYQWFEPARDYVLSERTYNGVVNTSTTFGTDSYTETSYADYGSGMQKNGEETYYFHAGEEVGYKQISYDPYGGVYYFGNYHELKENTPSAGWTTETSYSVDETTGEFVPEYKRELKGREEFGYDYEVVEYSYSNGEWEKRRAQSGQNIGNDLYKETYDNQVVYYKSDDEYGGVGQVFMNADGSYIASFMGWDVDGGSYVVFSYYDASHNKLRDVKRLSGDITVGDSEGSYYVFYIKKDGEWVLMDEYEETLSQGSTVQRTVYGFNDDGTPAYINIYQKTPSVNNGEEVLVQQDKYVYADNGYKVEYWIVYRLGGSIKMGLESVKEYYLLADGTYQESDIEYDDFDASVISYGTRVEEKDGIERHYTYRDGGWVLDNTYCNPLEYVTDDGVKVTINRYMDSENNIVNTTKVESKDVVLDNGTEYRMSAEYSWDESAGAWRGDRKSENKEVSIPFGYWENADPLAYDDEYLTYDEPGRRYNEVYLYADNEYEWDEATSDWKCTRSSDFDFTLSDANTLTYTKTSQDEYGKSVETRTIKCDAQRKLTGESVINETYSIEDGAQVLSDKRETTDTYTYNRYGYLETRTTVEKYNDGDAETTVYKYEYEDASILVPTDVDNIEGDAAGVRVSGRTVTVDGGAQVTLYDMSGRTVASGRGSVVAPAAGMYIARTHKSNVKVLVK